MSKDTQSDQGKKRVGVILVDLVAVVTALLILVALAGSVTSRATELSRRRLCALNLKSIGTTCQIYANENRDSWPVPAFKQPGQSGQNIKYVNQSGLVGMYLPEGEVGSMRGYPSASATPQNPSGGSTAVSVTRAFWMLVRSGDLNAEQFSCPSSADSPDPTENIDLYYDFTQYGNISYGFQVPFGPRATRPRSDADPRMIFAADKGPFYIDRGNISWEANGKTVQPEGAPRSWKRYNSPNHGGNSAGEGQNCLFADGHVSFERRPSVGVDNDNIYTVIDGQGWDVQRFNIIHGLTPHETSPADPYPGQRAFGSLNYQNSSTDSLIYP